MQPLNAIDAIAPAFTRTHETLAYPFRIGRAWKLCASQYLALAGSIFVPFPLMFFVGARFMPQPALFPQTILLLIALFYTVILLLVVYFGGRMELVAFEMVVTRAKFIAPMWRRYGTRIWPWLGWKILVGTVVCIVICGIAYIPLRQALTDWAMLVSHMGPKPDPAAFQGVIGHMIKMEGIFFLLFFLLKIPSTLFHDFVLPFFVLEDISLTASIQRGLELVAADPLQVLLYLVMKPILFILGCIMMEIALFVCMIPIVIAGVIIGLIGGVVLGHNHPAAALLIIPAFIALYGLFIWASLGAFGYLIMLLEAYGIYFLGGRYPLLGNLLDPGPGQPFTPPPVFPSSDERNDDDGSPPMPMNPAVA